MRVALCLLLTTAALAGCADPPSEDPISPGQQEAYAHQIDFLDPLPQDAMSLYAFQATGPTIVDMDRSTLLRTAGATAHYQTSLFWPHAPVDALLARADGDLEAPLEEEAPRGSGGGGGCGPDRVVRVAGTTVADDPVAACSSRGGGGGSFTGMRLDEGDWILVGAGTCGIEPEHVRSGSHWDVRVAANRSMEMIQLPAAPYVCDAGFDALYENSVLGVRSGEARLSIDTVYGASLGMINPGEIDGEWHLAGEELPFSDDHFWRNHTSSAGPAGFTVRDDDGEFGKRWSILGI